MTTRVWRELAAQWPEQPRTAAQDAVVRLALGMWVFDVRAGLTGDQRQRLIARLHDTERLGEPFTVEEKARLRAPLLAYCKEYHVRIYDIVEAQFPQPIGEGGAPKTEGRKKRRGRPRLA